jgi:hypothetical protein
MYDFLFFFFPSFIARSPANVDHFVVVLSIVKFCQMRNSNDDHIS